MAASGKISCGCGEVVLHLPNPRPKFRCGCCCSDCLQRAFIGARGKPRSEIAERLEPIDLIYVDSVMFIPNDQTLDRLEVFRINDSEGDNISLRASCCGAVLCTENQQFHTPHSMATFTNLNPEVNCEFEALPQTSCHLFTCDWSEKGANALAQREVELFEEARPQIFHPVNELQNPLVQALVTAFQRPAAHNSEQFTTFKQLREHMSVDVVDDYFDVSHEVFRLAQQ